MVSHPTNVHSQRYFILIMPHMHVHLTNCLGRKPQRRKRAQGGWERNIHRQQALSIKEDGMRDGGTKQEHTGANPYCISFGA